MPTTTQRRRQPETPRSIALSRHRTPFRWLADALRRTELAARWPWAALGSAALSVILLL